LGQRRKYLPATAIMKALRHAPEPLLHKRPITHRLKHQLIVVTPEAARSSQKQRGQKQPEAAYLLDNVSTVCPSTLSAGSALVARKPRINTVAMVSAMPPAKLQEIPQDNAAEHNTHKSKISEGYRVVGCQETQDEHSGHGQRNATSKTAGYTT
jgi:hypothetical protein